MLEKLCETCKQPFEPDARRTNPQRYCSAQCFYQRNGMIQNVICPVCGTGSYKQPSRIKRGDMCCTQKCGAIMFAQQRRKGRLITCPICGKETYKKHARIEQGESACSYACAKMLNRQRKQGLIAQPPNTETRRHQAFLAKLRHHNLRLEVLKAYGAWCACCSENTSQFLAIDHINGRGRQHRQTSAGANFYRWLKEQGFPLGYRVLCHNCNMALGLYGVCPHNQVITTESERASSVQSAV